MKPRISIVTPSFNMLSQLKRCHASVSDQGVEVQHVIADGGSHDGTAEWLSQQPGLSFLSERDNGMYDALNKAVKIADADIIGHLNCDEQYLPGVLAFVVDYFEKHDDVDFLCGDYLVTDGEANLLAYRKSFQPRWPYFFSNYLYTNTCTLFYRRKIFDKLKFDTSYKSIADVIFVYNVLKSGFKGIHIPRYFAIFTYTGKNLSLHPISAKEKKRFYKTLPLFYRAFRRVFALPFYIERILHGNFFQEAPLTFQVFVDDTLSARVTKSEVNPTFRLNFKWKETEQ